MKNTQVNPLNSINFLLGRICWVLINDKKDTLFKIKEVLKDVLTRCQNKEKNMIKKNEK